MFKKTLFGILVSILVFSISLSIYADDEEEVKTQWKLELVDKGYIPTKEIIFVVDISGSMRGAAYSNAKLAVDYIVTNQSFDKDYFIKIYAFNDEVRVWRDEWTAMPDPKEWEKALTFLKKFTGSGNTLMAKAVKKALDENDKSKICLFLITDGDPSDTDRDTTLKEILKSRGDSPTVIHTIFIQEYGLLGSEKSRDFLRSLAKETGGNFVIIKQVDTNPDKPF